MIGQRCTLSIQNANNLISKYWMDSTVCTSLTIHCNWQINPLYIYCRAQYTIQGGIIIRSHQSPLYLPCQKWFFFARLQIFLHASCNFLPPEELPPHAKNDECGFWCLQIWSRNLHNWRFLEIFVQIPKNISSQSCIKCAFAAWKKLCVACPNKISPCWKFSTAC